MEADMISNRSYDTAYLLTPWDEKATVLDSSSSVFPLSLVGASESELPCLLYLYLTQGPYLRT